MRLLLLVAGALALGGLRLLARRRRVRDASPKLDSVSSDWLAQARGRDEHTP